MNKIPFFLPLSRKICFTAVNHLADGTVPQIFKALKEMYQYYLQRGFHITMVHADGEITPLKTSIESMTGGPMVNLASANIVPPGREAAPQECVGSQTRDRAKQGPGHVKKIADPTIFNQSTGKSVSYAHAARIGMEKHAKSRSLLLLASK
jgi:hypothetical protein